MMGTDSLAPAAARGRAERRRTGRRPVIALVVALAAVALGGCGGETEPATDVAHDRATLHARGRCDFGVSATWFYAYRRAGDASSFQRGAAHPFTCSSSSGTVTLPAETVTGLTPTTTYEFRIEVAFNNGSTTYADATGRTGGTSYDRFTTAAAPETARPITAADTTTTTTAALPAAPQSYALPSNAVHVSTSQQLVSELANSTAQDIILDDGTYTTTGTTSSTPYFHASTGDRLWAAHLGEAVLRSGMTFGGNYGSGGGEVHGLAFNISTASLTQSSSAIYTWGPAGVGTKVYDTTIDGNYAIDSGIAFYQVEGTVIQRVLAQHLLAYGIRVSDNSRSSTAQVSRITDVDVDGVRAPTPGSSNGTAEFGIWIGNRVQNPVQRLRSEHGYLGGLWTGASSRDTTFRDITISTVDVSRGGVAVYNEHDTIRDTFEHFNLGPDVGTGFNCEWNYGSGLGACQHNTYRNGTIASQKAGVFLDLGSVYNSVENVRFQGQRCAAIVDNRGTTNTYTNNDYTGIASGAAVLSQYCY